MNTKYVVITGASTGIGEACAKTLAESGFHVFAGVRSQSDFTRLSTTSKNITPIMLDVTQHDSIANALQTITTQTDQLFGLVNNAGIVVSAPIEAVPLDDFRQQIEVNVTGLVACTQAFLPLLRRGTGRIVNIGSVSGRMALPFLGPYAASKFAVEAISDSLRRELKPWNISVSVIEPGQIETPIWTKSQAVGQRIIAKMEPQKFALYESRIKRFETRVESSTGTRLPVVTVTRAVAHALTSSKPKTRYLVIRKKWLQKLIFNLMPDRLMDTFIEKNL